MKDTITKLPKSPTELIMKINSAQRGEWISYYTGGCILEHGTDITHQAWREYMAGHVTLVQRRLSHGRMSQFEYIAVKL